jgi:membrane-associated phospholipid phosphatase
MDRSKKSYRTWIVLLIALSLLFSGTASAFTASYNIDVPTGLPPLDRSERMHNTYRILAYTFEEQFNMAETAQSESRVQPDVDKGKVPSLSTYGKNFFPDLVGGTKRIFSRDNLPLALIGAGLAGLSLIVDHKVKDYFQEHRPLNNTSKTGDTLGQGYIHAGIGAMLAGAGELSNDKRMADTGVVTLEALLINGIATEGLKYAVGRKRPNGGNTMSFPAGHASMTATLAASISEMYDWDLRIAIPLYLTTAFVGASRIQANEHYLSDVIAGITLGTVVGTSIAKYHKEKNNVTSSWQNISISPVFDKDLKGCMFTLRF